MRAWLIGIAAGCLLSASPTLASPSVEGAYIGEVVTGRVALQWSGRPNHEVRLLVHRDAASGAAGVHVWDCVAGACTMHDLPGGLLVSANTISVEFTLPKAGKVTLVGSLAGPRQSYSWDCHAWYEDTRTGYRDTLWTHVEATDHAFVNWHTRKAVKGGPAVKGFTACGGHATRAVAGLVRGL